MKQFVERVATNKALNRRKLIQGVGVNDAWYATGYHDKDGRNLTCPYYSRWVGMLSRCYNRKYSERLPTYIGCSVNSEWHLFSTFRKWMELQDWEGKQLDKDILVRGNKVYSQTTCVFVSSKLNGLLVNSSVAVGEYPIGVGWDKTKSKYYAQCNNLKGPRHLGYFLAVTNAEKAYCVAKYETITDFANQPEAVSQPILQEALLCHAKVFSDRVAELSVQQSQHT